MRCSTAFPACERIHKIQHDCCPTGNTGRRANLMIELQKQIVEFYLKNGSMKHTAIMFEISTQLVRRYLINAGVYSTPQIKAANELYSSGSTVEQIADSLCISRKAVISMLPYRKGTYKAPPSPNALRIRECRERKNRTINGL